MCYYDKERVLCAGSGGSGIQRKPSRSKFELADVFKSSNRSDIGFAWNDPDDAVNLRGILCQKRKKSHSVRSYFT